MYLKRNLIKTNKKSRDTFFKKLEKSLKVKIFRFYLVPVVDCARCIHFTLLT